MQVFKDLFLLEFIINSNHNDWKRRWFQAIFERWNGRNVEFIQPSFSDNRMSTTGERTTKNYLDDDDTSANFNLDWQVSLTWQVIDKQTSWPFISLQTVAVLLSMHFPCLQHFLLDIRQHLNANKALEQIISHLIYYISSRSNFWLLTYCRTVIYLTVLYSLWELFVRGQRIIPLEEIVKSLPYNNACPIAKYLIYTFSFLLLMLL